MAIKRSLIFTCVVLAGAFGAIGTASARECKSEAEKFCPRVRPGSRRIVACLKQKSDELSPICLTALKSTD